MRRPPPAGPASVPGMDRRFRHRHLQPPAAEVAAFLRGLPDDDRAAARAWRVAVAALLAARHLEHPVDLLRVLEMALVRVVPGPAEALRDRLDPDNGLHLFAARLELDTAGTSEARLVETLAALLDGRAAVPRDRFLRRLGEALADRRGAARRCSTSG